MRTVIFGVDGLTFRVLHPLMERGDLPNFRKLRDEGCEAVLESRYPPLTAPAWSGLSTGLKPARHGVYDFWEYEDQQKANVTRTARVVTHRKGGKAIWNILSEYGKRVLVINVPLTYPPEAVNGIMVSGYMTPGEAADFTYPAAFKEELYRIAPDYEIDMKMRELYRGDWETRIERLVEAAVRMTEQRMELLIPLLKDQPWDFCYVVFVGPDRLQHPLWDEISALDARTSRYFQVLDTALGQVLEQLGPEDSLFVVSDHGFQGASSSFDINEYLYSKGLLKINATAQREKARRFAEVKFLLGRVGLLSLARRARQTLRRAGLVKKRHAGGVYKPALIDVDWTQTKAYVPSLSGYGGGYADVFLDADMEAERIAELCDDLKRQVEPLTGRPLIDAIYTTEVFGTGTYAPREQHLILLPGADITFSMNLGNKRLWNDARSEGKNANKRRGIHQKDGVLYAYGYNIKRNFSAPNAEIYDLVPTVLRSLNLPLPYTFDGRVLDELFVEQGQEQQATTVEGCAAEGGLARRKLKKLLEMEVLVVPAVPDL